MILSQKLVALYVPLLFWITVGWILGRTLPPIAASRLGHFLFWVGVPLSIVVFIRDANLTQPVWLAAAIAWMAIVSGGLMALAFSRQQTWSPETQGSFYLATLFGNTGYLGYPVILTLLGSQAFGWALFYDLAGTTLGAYGLGVAIAGFYGRSRTAWRQLIFTMVKNPAIWSLPLGLSLRDVMIPSAVDHQLTQVAWGIVNLALVLIGMRLSSLSPKQPMMPILLGLSIKMLWVPLVLGFVLHQWGLTGDAYRAVVLQMAMPPAFATLVLTETFNLDRDLTVAMLVGGSLGFLVLIPFWLWILN